MPGQSSNEAARRAFALALCAVLVTAGCGSDSGSSSSSEAVDPPLTEAPAKVRGPEPRIRLKDVPLGELVIQDLRPGSGGGARPGDELTSQFVAAYVTGKPFESSWDPGNRPFSFRLGANEASPGWERGLRGMKEGGRRKLIVPPALSSRYGVAPGSGPEDTLIYVVDLLELDGTVTGESQSGSLGRAEPNPSAPAQPAPRNLVVEDLIEGGGEAPAEGDQLTVEYVGVRYDGTPFTNSWKRRKPFRFLLGGGSYFVNPGWEQGLPGMRVGGRRKLIVPPQLLSRSGAPPESQPEDALIYVIDLVAASKAPPKESGLPSR